MYSDAPFFNTGLLGKIKNGLCQVCPSRYCEPLILTLGHQSESVCLVQTEDLCNVWKNAQWPLWLASDTINFALPL